MRVAQPDIPRACVRVSGFPASRSMACRGRRQALFVRVACREGEPPPVVPYRQLPSGSRDDRILRLAVWRPVPGGGHRQAPPKFGCVPQANIRCHPLPLCPRLDRYPPSSQPARHVRGSIPSSRATAVAAFLERADDAVHGRGARLHAAIFDIGESVDGEAGHGGEISDIKAVYYAGSADLERRSHLLVIAHNRVNRIGRNAYLKLIITTLYLVWGGVASNTIYFHTQLYWV